MKTYDSPARQKVIEEHTEFFNDFDNNARQVIEARLSKLDYFELEGMDFINSDQNFKNETIERQAFLYGKRLARCINHSLYLLGVESA